MRLRNSICGILVFALAGANLAAVPEGWAGQDIGDKGAECQGASNPDPPDGSVIGPEVWAEISYMSLDYTPCAEQVSHTGYFSDNEQDIIERDPAHCLGAPPWPAFSSTAFVVGYDDPAIPEYARAPLVPGATYYWCVDTWDGAKNVPGPTWSFTRIDDQAWGPSPADGEQHFLYQGTMTWNLGDVEVGDRTLNYNVYMGMDETAVSDANTASPEYAANVVPESYDYSIYHGVERFWRVDTKLQLTRPPFTSTIIPGDVWSFTVSEPNAPYMTDFNHDGITDFNDYAVLANDWPKTGPNLLGDTNGNNRVNHYDLRLLAANWLSAIRNRNSVVIDGIRCEIETDKPVYRLGENVCFAYRVINETHISPSGQRYVEFSFNTSQWYDFSIKQSGEELWRWSYGKGFSQMFTSFTLAPGEYREFFECWSMVDNDDEAVGPGLYTISESYLTPGGVSLDIRIKGP